jgi:hypothetical protein
MHSITKRLIEDLPRSRQQEAWEDFADTLRWLRYAKRDGYVPTKWSGMGKALVEDIDEWLEPYTMMSHLDFCN